MKYTEYKWVWGQEPDEEIEILDFTERVEKDDGKIDAQLLVKKISNSLEFYCLLSELRQIFPIQDSLDNV